jgi:hypothetical protein
MDIERELGRLEAWERDILPHALAGDAQAAFTVLDIIEEKFILLGLAEAYPTSKASIPSRADGRRNT